MKPGDIDQEQDSIPCPSCGFCVFPEREYGSFDICPICNWEDCAVQFGNPLDAGGPNRESLVDYQRASIAHWPLTTTSIESMGDVFRRDSSWRPFTNDEIETYQRSTAGGRELHHPAVWKLEEAYWNRSIK
jgi:hypothetical protein